MPAVPCRAVPRPAILVTNANDGFPLGDIRDWGRAIRHKAIDLMMPGPKLGLPNGASAGLVGFVGGLRHWLIDGSGSPGTF